jgi:phosphoribosylpyrophosphate synthetase
MLERDDFLFQTDMVKDQKIERLARGLKNRKDPVTWRTLTIDLRYILGSNNPELSPPSFATFAKGKRLVESLTKDTFLEPLQAEVVWSIYGEYGEQKVVPSPESLKAVDFLLINGRHKTGELFWTLADRLKAEGNSVAVINPVGHYNDHQTRIVAPEFLINPVRTAVFLSSTQTEDGGDLAVLDLTLRILRNPNFSYMIDKVIVAMPMFGGSRGHKVGQSSVAGFEILETIYNSKLLTRTVDDIRKSIVDHDIYPRHEHILAFKKRMVFPEVKFLTVDIHNDVLPARKFAEAKYPFISVSAAKEQAKIVSQALTEKNYRDLPKNIVACDIGSSTRTEDFAREILSLEGGDLNIIYLKKMRGRNGKIISCRIDKIETCRLDDDNNLAKSPGKIEGFGRKQKCACIYIDDMVDTGGTAGSDIVTVKKYLPNSKYIVFVATHPIFSKGIEEALRKIGADLYLVGNTLNTKGLRSNNKIKVVDVAPSIIRALSD